MAALAFSGFVATAFCYWAVVVVNRTFSALTTSMALLAVPVVGVLLGALVLGEAVDAFEVAGIALVIGGVASTARKPLAP